MTEIKEEPKANDSAAGAKSCLTMWFVFLLIVSCFIIYSCSSISNRTVSPVNNPSHYTPNNINSTNSTNDQKIKDMAITYRLGPVTQIDKISDWAGGERYSFYTTKNQYFAYFKGSNIVSIRDKNMKYIYKGFDCADLNITPE
jgi:hypothetical protein